MPRRKRLVSKVTQLAAARAAGLDAISPPPDFGPGVSIAGFKARIEATRGKHADYNTCLAETDRALFALKAEEADLREYHSQILAAVVAMFGRDSNEYEMVGGTPMSARRRRRPAADSVPPPPEST